MLTNPQAVKDPWFQQRFRTGSMVSGMNFNRPSLPMQTLPRHTFESRFQPPVPQRNMSTSVFNLNQPDLSYMQQMQEWNAMQQVS